MVGPVVKRLGERNALLMGLVASAVGQFLISGVDVWWKLFFVAVPLSFGTSMTRPSLTSLVTKTAPPDRRGGVLGVTSSIESFSRIVAPIAGGVIIGHLHPTWIGYVGGVLGVQLGVRAGAQLRGEQLRALLAILVVAVALRLLVGLVTTPNDIYSIVAGTP